MNVSSGTVTSDFGASEVYSSRLIWVLRCLCLTGLSVSVYLGWTAFSMSPVFGCGGGEIIDCNHVLNSRWSKVMGIPVSVPAAGLYSSLLVLLFFVRRDVPAAFARLIWNSLTAGGCLAGLAALWFIGLQIFVVNRICPYCVAVHCCGLVLAAIVLRNRYSTRKQKMQIASLSVAAVAILITTQMMSPEPQTYKIIRYDGESSANGNSGDASISDADIFEAPGEIFEAPGEIFEAPGQDPEPPATVNATPSDVEEGSKSNAGAESVVIPVEATSDESPKVEGGDPVAAALLMVLPPRITFFSQTKFFFQEGSKTDEAEASSSGDETAKDTNTAEIKPEDKATSEVKKEAETVVPERKVVTVAGNRVTLDVKQWPLLGKPEAKYIFVEMFDYTCPHCRNSHNAIKGAFEKFGDDLAILALPVPLERSCNDAANGGGHVGACELARIAVCVWRVSPAKFREFHDWMFESTRSTTAARSQAEKLVGTAEFKKEYDSKIPAEFIQRHVALYKKVGQGSVPKLLFPNSTIDGEINNKVTLCNTIERELKVSAKE